MYLSNIFKAISFSLLIASSFAEKACEDLELQYIESCVFDQNDELLQIDLDTNYQELSDYESLFSHSSLSVLTLRYFDFTQELIDKIASLPNLRALELTNFNIKDGEELHFEKLNEIEYVSVRSSAIQKLSNFQNIVKLEINEKITQSDVDALSTFTNISELIIADISIHGLNLDKLKNLNNLSSLKLSYLQFQSFPTFVYSLTNLRSLDIEGDDGLVIPDEVFNLGNLQYLDLSSNYITEISPNIGYLEGLTTLYLHDNRLITLPKEIGNLKNLEELNLANNQITYIPKEISNLKNLVILYMENNKIRKIPDWLGELTSLEAINLSYNNIFSEIPDSFHSLTNLKELYLQENANIEGKVLAIDGLLNCVYSDKYDLCVEKDVEIPCLDPELNYKICSEDMATNVQVSTNGSCGPNVGKCPSGQCCNKDGKCETDDGQCLVSSGYQAKFGTCVDGCEEIFNFFEKRDPGSYEDIVEECLVNGNSNVKSLYIKEMKVDQKFVDFLSALTELEEWGCDYCSYDHRTNYDGLKSLTQLTTIHIYSKEGEKFTDVPSFVTDIPNLKKLIIRSNDLNTITDSITNIKNLEYLDLYNNEIQTIPSSISKLKNLKYLDLSANKIPNIPESLGTLKSLEYLNLYENDIEKVPNYIKNLKNLQYINLSDNNITEISDELYSLQNITSLELRYNKIKNLSDRIVNLSELKYFSIAGNELKAIPSTIQYLKKLQHLDFEDNKLSTIPEFLSELENLEYLNLNLNKIYSELPDSLNNLNKLKEIYLEENLNIKGRTLTNKSLVKCFYSDHYDLCLTKSMRCMNDDVKYTRCGKEEYPISTNGNCNSSDGRCPYGQCCNKEGRCVQDENSCLLTSGCQIEFGFCIDECQELYNMVMSTTDNNLVESCIVNKNGTMKALKFEGFDDDYQPFINKVGSFKDLEELSFYGMDIEDFNYDALTNLKNIQSIHIGGYLTNDKALLEIPEFIFSLTSLRKLEVQYNNITVIPDEIANLQNLEILDLEENHLFRIPAVLGELKNLQHLHLHYNKLYSRIPDSLNQLPNLKGIYLYGNINIKGKTLTNDSLEDCKYDPSYTLCMPKTMKCMDENAFKICDENDVETDIDECDQIYTYVRSIIDIKKKDFTDIIRECYINKEGTVKSLVMGTIDNPQGFINNIVNLPDIEELTFESLKYKPGLKFNSLTKLKKLTTLRFVQYHRKPLTEIPEAVLSLENLQTLIIDDQKLTSIPDTISNLQNLKMLRIVFNEIKEIPSAIGELKNLETLELDSNEIDCELPESLNSLPKLKKIVVSGNVNVTGQTLTNESLEVCEYEEKYTLCVPEMINCIKDSVYGFKPCFEDTQTDLGIDDNTISQDNRCGKGKGRCPVGLCCSAFGWCGNSENHCAIKEGCQSEFGECKGEAPTKISVNGKCNSVDGRCPDGQCCSKDGECGTTLDHCAIESGCQYEFGKCINGRESVNGRCGLAEGKCPDGKCCSKYGYCSSEVEHCSVNNGCQPEFGTCSDTNNFVKGQCGEGYGSCPPGQCCSKYGWCGKDSQYCGAGCQSNFGSCY